MKIDPNKHHRAIGCDSSCGPRFGDDICIKNNANTTIDSLSHLGDCYKHPQYGGTYEAPISPIWTPLYGWGTNEAQSFLAGSNYFQLDEIEVYHKE